MPRIILLVIALGVSNVHCGYSNDGSSRTQVSRAYVVHGPYRQQDVQQVLNQQQVKQDKVVLLMPNLQNQQYPVQHQQFLQQSQQPVAVSQVSKDNAQFSNTAQFNTYGTSSFGSDQASPNVFQQVNTYSNQLRTDDSSKKDSPSQFSSDSSKDETTPSEYSQQFLQDDEDEDEEDEPQGSFAEDHDSNKDLRKIPLVLITIHHQKKTKPEDASSFSTSKKSTTSGSAEAKKKSTQTAKLSSQNDQSKTSQSADWKPLSSIGGPTTNVAVNQQSTAFQQASPVSQQYIAQTSFSNSNVPSQVSQSVKTTDNTQTFAAGRSNTGYNTVQTVQLARPQNTFVPPTPQFVPHTNQFIQSPNVATQVSQNAATESRNRGRSSNYNNVQQTTTNNLNAANNYGLTQVFDSRQKPTNSGSQTYNTQFVLSDNTKPVQTTFSGGDSTYGVRQQVVNSAPTQFVQNNNNGAAQLQQNAISSFKNAEAPKLTTSPIRSKAPVASQYQQAVSQFGSVQQNTGATSSNTAPTNVNNFNQQTSVKGFVSNNQSPLSSAQNYNQAQTSNFAAQTQTGNQVFQNTNYQSSPQTNNFRTEQTNLRQPDTSSYQVPQTFQQDIKTTSFSQTKVDPPTYGESTRNFASNSYGRQYDVKGYKAPNTFVTNQETQQFRQAPAYEQSLQSVSAAAQQGPYTSNAFSSQQSSNNYRPQQQLSNADSNKAESNFAQKQPAATNNQYSEQRQAAPESLFSSNEEYQTSITTGTKSFQAPVNFQVGGQHKNHGEALLLVLVSAKKDPTTGERRLMYNQDVFGQGSSPQLVEILNQNFKDAMFLDNLPQVSDVEDYALTRFDYRE